MSIMDIRKVQKTGDMHYVYLPTSWCKRHKIDGTSKLFLEENKSGVLTLSPTEIKKKEYHFVIKTDEKDQDTINKLIVACYINPLSSFKIILTEEIDTSQLLQMKNIVSLESVEIETNTISSQSSIHLNDPDLLFKTLIRKTKNMITMMLNSYNNELVKRYEEEIDRSKMLIEKAVIQYMSYSAPIKLKITDLYYVSLITRDLERVIDHLILFDEKEKQFIEQVSEVIQKLKEIIDPIDLQKQESFDHKIALEFVNTIKKIKKVAKTDPKYYDKRRIRSLLTKISEVVLDWSITNEIDK
jgi:phosphate uptake regulator